MGSQAVYQSTSSSTIKYAMEKTDAVNVLADQVLTVVPGYIGESYSSALEKVIKSESMKNFYADYLEDAIFAIINDDPLPSVNESALSNAFLSGFDEVEKNGDLGLSEIQIYLFELVKDQVITVAASSASALLSTVDSDMMGEDVAKAMSFLKILTSDTIRLGSMALMLLCIFALIILNFRKGGWLVIGGFNFIICGALFFFLTTRLGAITITETASDLIDRVIMIMFSNGTGQVGIVSFGLGILMLAVGVIYKLIRFISRSK
ncbi:MAG: hypothetical protein PUB09_06935 [Firmicutes bacterium]|nr:hypothetical protein [Bacillota bacterium]